MSARFSHIREHLRRHGVARDMLERSHREQAMASRLRALLPETLDAHCLDARIADGRLTLFLDSPAWLTRARFQTDAILTALTAFEIQEVKFQVRLNDRHEFSEPSSVTPSRRLSEAVVEHLLEAAEHQSDPGLSQALGNLARRHARQP